MLALFYCKLICNIFINMIRIIRMFGLIFLGAIAMCIAGCVSIYETIRGFN
jgi:hypothetical protein